MIFHLGDILSVTTGVLLSPERMGGVYKILGFMTGESLFTHQLPRAAKQCRPWLVKQFPQLAGINVPELQPGDVDAWVQKLAARVGERFDVQKPPSGENGPKCPVQEAVELFGKDRVIVVQEGEGNP